MTLRLAAALLMLAAPAGARDLRVMSFNVRLPLASDGPNDWPARRTAFVRTLRRADADVFGTQELYARQAADIVAALPRYAWFGRDRRGGPSAGLPLDEHMGVFYRRDRLRLLASGDWWLSDTPAVPGSISWGHPYPRMVTWGRFRTRAGRTFTLLNTHLPYRAEDGAAREKAARAIAARVAVTAGPVVVTGDFNDAPEGAPHRILTAALDDAWTAAIRRASPAGTFHGFTGVPGRRIDWVLVRGFAVREVRTLADRDGARWPSDHFPVVATLRFR